MSSLINKTRIIDAIRNRQAQFRLGPFASTVGVDGVDISLAQYNFMTRNTFINEVLSNVGQSGGFARSYNFRVSITPPGLLASFSPTNTTSVSGNEIPTINDLFSDIFGGLGAYDPSAYQTADTTTSPHGMRRINFNCHISELPGLTIGTIEHKVNQSSRLMPYTRMYNDQLSMQFYISRDGLEKKFFDNWQAMIVDPATHKVNYYHDYTTTIEIEVLAGDSNLTNEAQSIYKCYLFEAYPRVIAPVSLNYAEVGDVMQMSVTFAFKKWMNMQHAAYNNLS